MIDPPAGPLPATSSAQRIGPLVAILSLGHFLAFADRFVPAAVAPILQPAFRLTDTQLGWLLGPIFAVSYAAAAAALGRMADTQRMRAVLIGGVATWTIGSIVFALAGSFAGLAGGRLLIALGEAAFIPGALALLGSSARGGRASALSLFAASSPLGRNAGLLATGIVLALIEGIGVAAAPTGWRVAALLTLVPNLALIWLLWRYCPDRRPPAPRASSSTDYRALLTTFAAAVAPVVVIQSFAAWLPSLIVRVDAISAAHAATLVGLCGAIGAPTGPLVGGIAMARSQWCRAHPLAMTTIGLVAAVPALVAVTLPLPLAVLGLTIVLGNVALGISSFAALVGAQAAMPEERRSTLSGAFLALVTLVGAGLGPLLTGSLSDLSGAGSGHALGHALLTIVAAAVALSVVILLVPDKPLAEARS